jgi:site-specific recombinase XerC
VQPLAQWRSSAERLDSALKVYVLPTFASRRVNAISRKEVQAWVATLSDRLAPSTTQGAYYLLAGIMKAVVHAGLRGSSPCTKVNLPAVPAKLVVPLTVETVHALIDATSERYRALMVVLAGAGLRQGEGNGLAVDRIDFLRREVRVGRKRAC